MEIVEALTARSDQCAQLFGTETKSKPEEVIERAEAYFGEKGLGLEITEKDPFGIY